MECQKKKFIRGRRVDEKERARRNKRKITRLGEADTNNRRQFGGGLDNLSEEFYNAVDEYVSEEVELLKRDDGKPNPERVNGSIIYWTHFGVITLHPETRSVRVSGCLDEKYIKDIEERAGVRS